MGCSLNPDGSCATEIDTSNNEIFGTIMHALCRRNWHVWIREVSFV